MKKAVFAIILPLREQKGRWLPQAVGGVFLYSKRFMDITFNGSRCKRPPPREPRRGNCRQPLQTVCRESDLVGVIKFEVFKLIHYQNFTWVFFKLTAMI
ncbi:MAG: hypothetical protein IEMM0002_1540 [bacterium]|nr:MAG: hypothetical protein IEMM0002_1540 [bacterium]